MRLLWKREIVRVKSTTACGRDDMVFIRINVTNSLPASDSLTVGLMPEMRHAMRTDQHPVPLRASVMFSVCAMSAACGAPSLFSVIIVRPRQLISWIHETCPGGASCGKMIQSILPITAIPYPIVFDRGIGMGS